MKCKFDDQLILEKLFGWLLIRMASTAFLAQLDEMVFDSHGFSDALQSVPYRFQLNDRVWMGGHEIPLAGVIVKVNADGTYDLRAQAQLGSRKWGNIPQARP